MTHRTTRAAAVLVVVPLLATPACGPKSKLQALDTASVPAEVREHPPASPAATNVVWRDFHEEAGWYVAAVTFDLNTPLPSGAVVGSCYGIAFYVPDAEGTFHSVGGAGYTALSPDSFQIGHGTSGGGIGPSSPTGYSIYAHGRAFHPKAARVVGTTTSGREISGQVVNGFWGLFVADADGGRNEGWTSLVVVDANGRVLLRH